MDYGRQKKTVEPRKKVSHNTETRQHDKKKDKDKDKEKKKGRRSHSKGSSKHRHKSHSKSKEKKHKQKSGHETRPAGGGHGGQHAGGHSHASKPHPVQPAKTPLPAGGHKNAHVKEKDPAAKAEAPKKNEDTEIPAQEEKTTTEKPKPKIEGPPTSVCSPCVCCPCLDVPLTWWVLILTIVAIVLYLPGIGCGIYVIALDDVQLYKLWISFGSPNCDPHGRCVNVLGYLNIHNPKAIDFTFKTYIGLAAIMVVVNAGLIASIVFNQINAFVCFIHPVVLFIVVTLAVSAMIVFQIDSMSGVFIEGIAPLWFFNGLYETWIAVCWICLYKHVQTGMQVGLDAHSMAPTSVPEEAKTKSRHRTRAKDGTAEPKSPEQALGHSKDHKVPPGAVHTSKHPLPAHPQKEQHHPQTAKHHVSNRATHHKVAPHPVVQQHHPHKEASHPHKEASHRHKEAAHPHKEAAHPHKEAAHPHKEAVNGHHRTHGGSHHPNKEAPAAPTQATKEMEKETPEPRKESENEPKKSSQPDAAEEKVKTEEKVQTETRPSQEQQREQEQRTSEVPHQEEKEALGGLEDNPTQNGGQQQDQQTPRQSEEGPPRGSGGGPEPTVVASKEVVQQQHEYEQHDEQDPRGSAQEQTPGTPAVVSSAEITDREDQQQVAASSAHTGLSTAQPVDAELTPAEKKLMELIAERSKKGRVSVHRRREHHRSHHRGRSSDAKGRRRSSEGHRKRDRRK